MNLLQKGQYSWNIEVAFLNVLLELVRRGTQNFTIINQKNPQIEQIFIWDPMTIGFIM